MRFIDKFLGEDIKATKTLQDIISIGVVVLFVLVFSSVFSLFDPVAKWLIKNYGYQFDKIILIFVVIGICSPIFLYRRWNELKQEISKRKQIEKRMEKSSVQLQAVLDGVPDMIMQVDTNLRVLWANKAALSHDSLAIGKLAHNAFSNLGESVISSFTRWSMTTGIIEKGVKFQPAIYGSDVGTYWEGIGVPLRGTDGKVYGAISIARNVTERMRIEHTSNLLASIIESTDDAIYGMTYDSTILSWNVGAENTYGYKAAEVLGKHGVLLVPPEERKNLTNMVERVIRSQALERYDTTRIRKDGKEILVSVTLCPFVDATGRKIGVSAIDRDITDMKRAEVALRESETMFRELFENMSSGVVIHLPIDYGKDFIIKDFNRAGENIEKISKQEYIGFKVRKLMKTIDTPAPIDILHRVWESGVPEHLEVSLQRGGGANSLREIQVYKLPSGEIVAIYDDITERKRAEDNLLKSEEKFRTLVETAPDGIILFDTNSNIIELNRAFTNMFGYTPDEILGKEINTIFQQRADRSNLIELATRFQEDKNIPDQEFFAEAKDGSKIPVEISLATLSDAKGNIQGFIAIVRDISIRKQFEQELRNSREQLRSLAVHLQTAREAERKRIAFEIHDELGYALTAFKLDLVWLVKKMNVKDEALITKAKEMSELIEMTIQKVRTISSELRPSILDHFGLIAAIEWQAMEFQKRSAIRCRVALEPTEVRFSDNYATAIFRIFQETLTNVARHAKASRVDVSFMQKSSNFELKISDNGIGITKDDMKHQKSMGLVGMRERANSIGGNLDISPGEEGGTTVTLTIPMPDKEK